MNSAYSNLINNVPCQIPLSGNFQDQFKFNYSNNSPAQPLNIYSPTHDQTRIISSLQQPGAGNHSFPPIDPSTASQITTHEQNQILSTVTQENKDPHSPDLNSPFYPSPHPFQESNQLCYDFGSAWRSAAQIMADDLNSYPNYDNIQWTAPYGYIGNPTIDLNNARRKNATRESTGTLKAWLHEHVKNPYPTKGEKIMLAIITKMTLTQVSTWFANARRRLKKENKMTWSPKNRSDDATNSDQETEIKCQDHHDSDNELNSNCPLDNDEIHREFLSSEMTEPKPKIWSLAQTATSMPFPMALQPYTEQSLNQTTEIDLSVSNNQYSHHISMPLLQNYPLYNHGFNINNIDVSNQLPFSNMKSYFNRYSDNDPNSFFVQSQKRVELL